jgi:hypothetical protein
MDITHPPTMLKPATPDDVSLRKELQKVKLIRNGGGI